jgi:hypothetical protein
VPLSVDDAPRLILFGGFLDRLQREGFAVSTEDHLRLTTLMASLSEERMSCESLRTHLAPLFARSAEQQVRFGQVFDDHFKVGKSVPSAPKPQSTRSSIDSTDQRSPARKLSVKVLIASLLALCIAAGVVVVWRITHRPPPPATTTATTGTVAQAPPIPAPHPKSKRPTRLPGNRRTPLPWLVILIAIITATAALADVIRDSVLWWQRRRTRGSVRPFRWPLQRDQGGLLLDDSRSRRTAALLAGRIPAGDVRLDLIASIRATIRNGGFATPTLKSAPIVPEYIAFIERASTSDIRGTYYERVVDSMARRGVTISKVFNDGDPSIWIAENGDRHSVVELYARQPNARILVFGEADSIADRVTRKPSERVTSQLPWLKRAVLVPRFTTESAFVALHEAFVIHHADISGIEAVAVAFADGPQTAPRAYPDQTIDVDAGIDELSATLTPAAFRWLQACALNPELEWDVILAAGRALRIDDDSVLLELVSLPWCRSGLLPDSLRKELAEAFSSDPDAKKVHAETTEVLTATAAPERSYAASRIALQHIRHTVLAKLEDVATAETAAKQLRRFDPRDIKSHPDLMTALEVAGDHGLACSLPTMRCAIYRSGRPQFGYRRAVFLLAMLPFVGAMAIAAAAAVWGADTAATIGQLAGERLAHARVKRVQWVQADSAPTTILASPSAPSPTQQHVRATLRINFDTPRGYGYFPGGGLALDEAPYELSSQNVTEIVKGRANVPVDVSPGEWTLTASFQSFKPLGMTINVKPGLNYQNIVLQPLGGDPFTSGFISIVDPPGVSPSDVSLMGAESDPADEKAYQRWPGPSANITPGLWRVRLRNDFYDETLEVRLEAGKTTEVRFHEPQFGIVVFPNTKGAHLSTNYTGLNQANFGELLNGDSFLRANKGYYLVTVSGVGGEFGVSVTPGKRTFMEINRGATQAQSSQSATKPPTPRTSFEWTVTKNTGNPLGNGPLYVHTEWTRQRNGTWLVHESGNDLTNIIERKSRSTTWRELDRETVYGTTGVVVRALDAGQEVFIPDLSGGKNPEAVLIRNDPYPRSSGANILKAWETLVDLSADK